MPVGVLLPGRAYTAEMPLLALARFCLETHAYDVRPVWWEDPEPTEEFVRRHAVEALGDANDAVIAGKSLGTVGSTYAAERGFPAIWLTPLLLDAEVVAGIRDNPAPQVLVGGLADQFWDADVAAGLASDSISVLEIPAADHAMEVPDPARTAEILVEVAAALDTFLASLADSA